MSKLNKIRKLQDSHFNRLSSIESKIASICRVRGVTPDNLESHLDSFSVEDEDVLLSLLEEKLALQKLIFEMQGGCLNNTVFLAAHR